MPDLWVNDSTEYEDDDDLHSDHSAQLNFLPASVDVDLYVNQNVPATQPQVGTKSRYTHILGGAILFNAGAKSDYQLSMERLL